MATIDDLVQAIARYEGYAPGNIAYRNNNPGNLRSWGSYPVVDGYVKFPDAETGWNALRKQVELNISRGLSLNEFFRGGKGYGGYAPAADSNNPDRYAATVASWLGISPDVPLSSALGADGSNPFAPSDPTAEGADLTAADLTPSISSAVIEAAAVVGAIAFGWLLLPSRS